MIISKAHDFGFVHIPKCAGSTVRHQLRQFDDLGGRFYHTMQVDGLGRINGNHVPLDWLAEHFPGDYAALLAVKSYAITREPMDRFISATAQRIRFLGQEPGDISAPEIRRHCDRILADLGKSATFTDIDYIIFRRQTDYTSRNGAQVLTEVYPMENLDAFFAMLVARHGLPPLSEQVWNPTVTYKVPAMAGPLNRMKTLARRLLPVSSYAALRDLGIRTLTTRGAPRLNETMLGMSSVTAFVADYYREDAALHAAARARLMPAPA